ncbi:MAG: hypothetical protein B7Y35_07425 [Sphingomonadales bacterium 28-64-96]|nr:MAG: hypothetical protein B7Y35_07425 [Sphingomonadales bacterium 28-64-96]
MSRKTVLRATSGIAGAIRVYWGDGDYLERMERHGKLLDPTSRARAEAWMVEELGYFDESMIPDRVTTTGLDLKELYKTHMSEANFDARSDGKLLHLVVQFPTQLVDGEDARWMLSEARSFVESIMGTRAIFGDRVDRHETGRHTVDIFVAPIVEKKTKHTSKPTLSLTKGLDTLCERLGMKPTRRGPQALLKAYGKALQTAWFEHLEAAGVKGVVRGEEKESIDPDRVTPEVYKVRKERELWEREVKEWEISAEKKRENLEAEKARNEEQRAENDRVASLVEADRDAVQKNSVKLKSYDAVFHATIAGHLIAIGKAEAEARWVWQGPGSIPDEIKAGGISAWKMAKTLSERVDQAIDDQVTADKVAAAVAARVTKAAVNDKIYELASQQVTAAHIQEAANAKVTQADINLAIAARVTEDSIKAATNERVTPDMIKAEARLQVTEADKRAQAREMTTPADIAMAARDRVTQKDIDRALADHVEPLKAQAKAAQEAAIAAQEGAEQSEARTRALRAGIEAWLAGDIVDALEKDDGKKIIRYRDAEARQRWSEQVRLAFELVWIFVQKVTAQVRKAIQDKVTPELIREATTASITEEDRIAAAANSVTKKDREKAALGLLDQRLLLDLAAAPLADRQRVAGEALAAAQQEAGISPALQALMKKKGGFTK